MLLTIPQQRLKGFYIDEEDIQKLILRGQKSVRIAFFLAYKNFVYFFLFFFFYFFITGLTF